MRDGLLGPIGSLLVGIGEGPLSEPALQGQLDEAILHFRKALAANPQNDHVRENLKRALDEREQLRNRVAGHPNPLKGTDNNHDGGKP